MEPDKDTTPGEDNKPATEQQAPADALSRTPDDLDETAAVEEAAKPSTPEADKKDKQPSGIKRFLRRINVYLLFFVLLVVVGGAIAIVMYLNSQQVQPEPTIASQELSQEELQQLANTDASVGDTSQTLTIQGNAVIAGQTLMRGDLNVAGNLQTGGSIQGASLTISGETNLASTQINTLQVAQNAAIQGSTTLQDLSVSGTTSLSGPVTASQLTVTTLVLSGNASLQVPNHISFTGPSPSRSNGSALGNGGSASVNGSDTAGTVNISTGNNPSTGCLVQVTFNERYSNQPHVIVSPVGSGAGRTQYYVDRNQTGFSICTASPAPANQSFAYDYFVMN